MSGPARIPRAVADYFEKYVVGWDPSDRKAHPVIKQVFTPGKGWKNHPTNKRVSISWLRKLRDEGVTVIAVAAPTHPNRIVDFGIREVCRVEGGTGGWPCGICA